MRHLFDIEDVFDITGRGCVLVPGIPYDMPAPIKVGASIVIEVPNGRSLETTIAGFEMINRGRKMEHAPFCVPRPLNKDQLLIGSRVFLREKALVQYERVRVRKLVQPVDSYDGWRGNVRPPAVGDIGSLIDTLNAKDLPPKYVVEMCASDGTPIWLSDFWAEEIEDENEPVA